MSNYSITNRGRTCTTEITIINRNPVVMPDYEIFALQRWDAIKRLREPPPPNSCRCKILNTDDLRVGYGSSLGKIAALELLRGTVDPANKWHSLPQDCLSSKASLALALSVALTPCF